MRSYQQVQEGLIQRPRSWLVTGAAGFIGSHLVQALLRLNQRVAALDNLTTGSTSNLAQIKDAVTEAQWRNLRFIRGSIDVLDTCRQACRSVDHVLHEGALASVPHSIADPIGTHHANVTGLLNMLVAAHGAGVSRFIYAASGAIYRAGPGVPRQPAASDGPLSPYALTKYVDELYAEMFVRCYGFSSIGLRYFNVFGPRQGRGTPYAAVVPLWIVAMLHGKPAYIDGDVDVARDFCYVENIVHANLLAAAAEDEAANNRIYDIAMGEARTQDELFGLVRSLLQPRFPDLAHEKPVHRPARRCDMPGAQPDIGSAQRLLGYVPAWPLKQGLARTVAWYASRYAAFSTRAEHLSAMAAAEEPDT